MSKQAVDRNVYKKMYGLLDEVNSSLSNFQNASCLQNTYHISGIRIVPLYDETSIWVSFSQTVQLAKIRSYCVILTVVKK